MSQRVVPGTRPDRTASRAVTLAVRSAVVLGLVAAPFLVTAAWLEDPAGAQVTGGCSATIAGQDVGAARSASTAISVGADDTVTVSGTAPGPITGYTVYLSIGGRRFEAASGTVTDQDTTYTTTVNVADYARYGVGLYRLEADTTGTVCSTWAYVKVTGRFPLATAAGAVGAAATGLGLFGMIRAAMRSGARSAVKGAAA